MWKKWLAYSLDSLMIAVALLLSAAAIYYKFDVTRFYSEPLNLGDSLLFWLPSLSFYLFLFSVFYTIATPFFAKGLGRRVLLLLYFGLLAFIEALFIVCIMAMGDGASLYGMYYFLTQFNVLSAGFYLTAGVFYALCLMFLLFYLFAVIRKFYLRRVRVLLLINGWLLFLAFIPLSSAPKSLSLSGIAYALSSVDTIPSQVDFSQAPAPALQQSDWRERLKHNKTGKNIVIIVLESTRRDALSFFNPALKRKTPFFDHLASQGQAFGQMYSSYPLTIKALTAINCGLFPYMNFPILESVYGLPNTCLASELSKQGYDTLFLQSATRHYGNKAALAKQWGFEQFYGAEDLDRTGFKKFPFFGYEDSLVLAKSQQWLNEQKRPFFMMYLTIGPHFPYSLHDKVPYLDYAQKKTHYKPFDRWHNDYLNAVYQQDQFLQRFYQQFEQAGLADNTWFILLSDHGEDFAEHRHFHHANNLYQEALHIPLVVYSPGAAAKPSVDSRLLTQTDIPALVASLLNQGDTQQVPGHQAVFSSCWHWHYCIARTDKQYKFIHNFGDAPDELYDLQQDPREKHNIAQQKPEQLKRFKQQSLHWYYQQLALYYQWYSAKQPNFYIQGHPRLPIE